MLLTRALVSMRRSSSAPSLRSLRVANETWPPLATCSSTALCSAFSSSGMNASSRPTTSDAFQPNMRSAAGFQSVTVRSAPKAMIASAAHSMTARAVASIRSRSRPLATDSLRATIHDPTAWQCMVSENA